MILYVTFLNSVCGEKIIMINSSKLVNWRINIKNVTFLYLIIDYQFKNLISRLSIIKIS